MLIAVAPPELMGVLFIQRVWTEDVSTQRQSHSGTVFLVLGDESRDIVRFWNDVVVADEKKVALHEVGHSKSDYAVVVLCGLDETNVELVHVWCSYFCYCFVRLGIVVPKDELESALIILLLEALKKILDIIHSIVGADDDCEIELRESYLLEVSSLRRWEWQRTIY